MNYIKALMGLTLFASINTLAMKMDHDNNETYTIEDTNAPSAPSQAIVYYELYCAMCNEFVIKSPENKKVFHSRCLEMVADCDYVKNNPIITSEPWNEPTKLFENRYTAFKSYKRRMAKKNQPK